MPQGRISAVIPASGMHVGGYFTFHGSSVYSGIMLNPVALTHRAAGNAIMGGVGGHDKGSESC